MGIDHYTTVSGLGQCDISGKQAAGTVQRVLVMDIPISHQAQKGVRRSRKVTLEHQDPSITSR